MEKYSLARTKSLTTVEWTAKGRVKGAGAVGLPLESVCIPTATARSGCFGSTLFYSAIRGLAFGWKKMKAIIAEYIGKK